jgi:hypothetical protein
MRDFDRTSSELDHTVFDGTVDLRKSINLIEKEISNGNATLSYIASLRGEVTEIAREKTELLTEDNMNLNRSRCGSLLEGFNETIFELDLCKDNEMNVMLNKFHTDLDSIEAKLKAKVNEMRFKLEQQNIAKKQKKLNLLRDTLDLQLDTLVSLKQYNQTDFGTVEDLAKESDDILLDKVALDDTYLTNRSYDCSPIKSGVVANSQAFPGSPVRISRAAESLSPVRNASCGNEGKIVVVVRSSSIPVRVDPQYEKQISTQVQPSKRVSIACPKSQYDPSSRSATSNNLIQQINVQTGTVAQNNKHMPSPTCDVFSRTNSPQQNQNTVRNDNANDYQGMLFLIDLLVLLHELFVR